MELNFRTLNADEIEVRIGSINKGGVSLLLYKDARCDMNILDESVGPMNWQRHHGRENANCVVSIYDSEKKEWIEKEDTGSESQSEKEKGLASDSFKRACFNWGIGRELYTAPDLFIPKDKLKSYSYDEKARKGTCFDKFIVKGITYRKNSTGRFVIETVTIGVSQYGNVHTQITFGTAAKKDQTTPAPAAKPAQTKVQPKAEEKTDVAPEKANTDANAPISDDEVLLIGNCRGKKYGEVKNTKDFKSFMTWMKTAAGGYNNEAQNIQFKKLKAMATTSAA